MVPIGPRPQAGIDEVVLRHGRHGRQHAWIADSPLDQLLVDHATAGDRELVAQPGRGAVVAQVSRFHCSISDTAWLSVRSSANGVTEMYPSLTALKSLPGCGSHIGSWPPIQ